MSLRRLDKSCQDAATELSQNVTVKYIFARDQEFNIEAKTGTVFVVLNNVVGSLTIDPTIANSYNCTFRIIQKNKLGATKEELRQIQFDMEDIGDNFFFLLNQQEYVMSISTISKPLDYHRFDDNYSGLVATCTIQILPDASFC